jgi:hypothetical protein
LISNRVDTAKIAGRSGVPRAVAAAIRSRRRWASRSGVCQRVFAGLSTEELAQATGLLQRMLDNLRVSER